MFKIVNNNFIRKTMIALCVVVLMFTFVCPIKSQASDLKGFLIEPIISFFKFMFDVAEGLMQYYFVGGPINTFWVMVPTSDPILQNVGIVGDNTSIVDWDTSSGNVVEEHWADFDSWLGEVITFVTSNFTSSHEIPMTLYSPEAIFSNKIRAFSIDFISEPTEEENIGGHEVQSSIATDLRDNIANWYKTLRMLAAACMLPILIYVGIRIIISSASEKAKYKQMLMDWLVAMCLLFVMHYIMAIIINFTEAITNMINKSFSAIIVQMPDATGDLPGQFNTNLMGLVRFRAEYSDSLAALANTILYCGIVIYTFIFTWTYLKRTLMIAFLTLISPIITLTYPLDKLGDGKSQGFDIWFKEYLFNALIQPFHLILYTVLIGGAADISVDNPIIAIAAMAFLLPAEKILKKMFNFDKAQEGAAGSNGFAGLMGAANLASNAMQLKKLGDLNAKKSDGAGSGNGKGNAGGSNKAPQGGFKYTPTIEDGGINNDSAPTDGGDPTHGGTSTDGGGQNINYDEQPEEQSLPDNTNSNGYDDQNNDNDWWDYNDAFIGGDFGGQQGLDEVLKEQDSEVDTSDKLPEPPPDTSLELPGQENEKIKKQVQQNDDRKQQLKRKGVKALKLGAKTVAKGAAVGTMAAVGGAAGLIIGAMSGDPSKAFGSAISGALGAGRSN